MSSAQSVPWLALCKHCRREIESFRGLWRTGNDFMCPDGEHAHEPAVADEQEEEAS